MILSLWLPLAPNLKILMFCNQKHRNLNICLPLAPNLKILAFCYHPLDPLETHPKHMIMNICLPLAMGLQIPMFCNHPWCPLETLPKPMILKLYHDQRTILEHNFNSALRRSIYVRIMFYYRSFRLGSKRKQAKANNTTVP